MLNYFGLVHFSLYYNYNIAGVTQFSLVAWENNVARLLKEWTLA